MAQTYVEVRVILNCKILDERSTVQGLRSVVRRNRLQLHKRSDASDEFVRISR